MIAPSFVFFLSSIECEGLRDTKIGYGDGRDELEVRAGAFRRPRGSLRSPARSKTDPFERQLEICPMGWNGNHQTPMRMSKC
jgi:hypothetical protein